MKQKLKSAKIIILAIILAGLSFGCGSSNSGITNQPVTLNFWMPFEPTENIQPLINDYEALHPNVHIVYTEKDQDTYATDLINALASGNGPDIFSINNAWLPQYIDKITPLPATPVDPNFNFATYKRDFVSVAVQDFTENQTVYGVPLSIDSLALYYNKDLLGTAGIATPPKTWAELAQDVQLMKQQDSTGYFTRSGIAMGTNANVNRAVDILYLFMLQRGDQPYSSDGTTPTFAQPVQQSGNTLNPGVDALTFYTSFANPASPNYNWNAKSDYSIDAFANGRAAFLISYSYSRATIVAKAPNLNFDVAPVPQPDLSNPSVNFANYWGQVVSKQTKSPNTAWDFLKFISSKAELDKFYAQSKEPASRNDLISLQATDPDLGVFASDNLTAKDFYRPDQAKMDAIFGQMIDNVILNGVSVNDALNQAQQQAATLTAQ